MNSEAETAGTSLDSVKLVAAVLLILGAVTAYYYFADVTRVVRVLGLVGAGLLAALIAAQTTKGRETVGFLKDTQIEVRKVVWPTRDETLKTTGFVMLITVVLALFLWLMDIALGGITRWLMNLGS